MVHCVVVDCVNNTRGGNKNITFYRLPRDDSFKKDMDTEKSNVKNLPMQETHTLMSFTF